MCTMIDVQKNTLMSSCFTYFIQGMTDDRQSCYPRFMKLGIFQIHAQYKLKILSFSIDC